jgi:hypothetical protein
MRTLGFLRRGKVAGPGVTLARRQEEASMGYYTPSDDDGKSGHTDIITREQLLAAGWTEQDIRQLPTPHGPADRPYWLASDIAPWLEDGRP